jgi:large subunit ribosomal protein L15
MPLQRVVPKYGFNNINRVEYKAINLATLQTLADEKQITDIDLAALVSVGLVSKRAKVKILANGAVTTALTVKAHAFSQAARTAIEAAGGKTELIQSKNAQSTIDA